MWIGYDKETDTLNIRFLKAEVYDSEYLEDNGVVVDYDKKNRVVNIEILSYSKKTKKGFKVDLPIEAVRA